MDRLLGSAFEESGVSAIRKTVTITRTPGVAPAEIAARAGEHALTAALIYSPNRCDIGRIDKQAVRIVRNGEEREADLASAYEIRAFGRGAELRWVRTGVQGHAVLISDDAPNVANDFGVETIDTIAQLRRIYRLWGKRALDDPPKGWSALSSGRVGMLVVPTSGGTGKELALEAREYVCEHESGNAVVMFERLVGFADAVSLEGV